MSFIDEYLSKYRLDKIPEKHKNNLRKLEDKLSDYVKQSKGPMTFEDCLKEHGTQLSNLVERVSNYVSDFKKELSWTNALSIFRFVQSISIEVYQIVRDISGCVVDDSMSDKEKHDAKVMFGKELVYFVWKTVDPIKDQFNWLPFKQTIEKKIVMWLAGMGLETTVDLFIAMDSKKISIMSNKNFIEALA